ncbi:MAG: ABC transporter permease [Promicromonosporaceae bacterium]|nr:ABC transporter permease [Promicromonosporaceae bacterium]
MPSLTPLDLLRTAGTGLTGRPLRTALSALGVALGIASLVALTGVSASNQAQLLAELDALGADLAIVWPGSGHDQQPLVLPKAAPEMIARQDGVLRVGVFETPPQGLGVFRTDLMPITQTGGITVSVARPDVLAAVDAQVASGRWFDEATRGLPVTVLGATAAQRLGVERAGDRVFIGGQWYGVLGILADSGLAGGIIETSAILGDRWVRERFAVEDGIGDIAEVFVRAEPGRIAEVTELLASTANPGAPHQVSVTRLADLSAAREAADDALTTLGLALGGIALLVGGVGITNTMVVTVMERRGEIGLRRALGARPGQIATQFTAEAIALSALGGLAGLALGATAAAGFAIAANQPIVIPTMALLIGPLLSIVVGALAGLQPATRAARVSPTVALRSV